MLASWEIEKRLVLFLPLDERLEMVVDDRLIQLRDVFQASRMKKDGVASEPLGHAGDARLGALGRTRDLTMRRAGRQSGGDLHQQLRPFQVVGRREGLARASLSTRIASEARDPRWIMEFAVGTPTHKSERRQPMSAALRPRTERREEPGRTHIFDGMLGPAHAGR